MRTRYTLIFLFGLFTIDSFGQPGYTQIEKKDGLKISKKWAKARDESGEKRSALLLALDNTNEHSMSFSIEMRFYYEGILKETGMIEDMCLSAKKSSIGRLNGLYFIPEKFTDQQLNSSDFNLEVDLVSIEKVEGCVNEN